MNAIAKSVVAATLLAMFASAQAAPVTYDFTFTDEVSGLVDGAGSFVTGAPAADAGYFLLTSLTFTAVRTSRTAALLTGSDVETIFQPGSAYDPTTGAFVNHLLGNTYDDYGSGEADGSIGGYEDFRVSADSFSNFSNELLGALDGLTSEAIVSDNTTQLTIVAAPATVPEPGNLALFGIGLIGLFRHRRTAKHLHGRR